MAKKLVVKQHNVRTGEGELSFDIERAAGRLGLAETITKRQRGGFSVYLRYMGDDFPVGKYDAVANEFVLKAKNVRKGEPATFRIKATPSCEVTIVGQVTGG